MTRHGRRWDADHQQGQTVAASVILDTPERYGAGLVRWARMVLGRCTTMPAPAVACPSVQERAGTAEQMTFEGME